MPRTHLPTKLTHMGRGFLLTRAGTLRLLRMPALVDGFLKLFVCVGRRAGFLRMGRGTLRPLRCLWEMCRVPGWSKPGSVIHLHGTAARLTPGYRRAVAIRCSSCAALVACAIAGKWPAPRRRLVQQPRFLRYVRARGHPDGKALSGDASSWLGCADVLAWHPPQGGSHRFRRRRLQLEPDREGRAS